MIWFFGNFTAQISLRDPENRKNTSVLTKTGKKAENAIVTAATEKGLNTINMEKLLFSYGSN